MVEELLNWNGFAVKLEMAVSERTLQAHATAVNHDVAFLDVGINHPGKWTAQDCLQIKIEIQIHR